MLLVSLGIYFLFMAVVWGFFIFAKVHFFKFREYSRYIFPVTKIIMLLLVVLTILGVYFVYKAVNGEAQVKTAQEAAVNDVY